MTSESFLPNNPNFFGRTAELEKLTDFFGSSSALPTTTRVALIVGPAAVGKTSLARLAVDRLKPYFPDGVIFVSGMHIGVFSSESAGVPRDIYMEILEQVPGNLPDLRLHDDSALWAIYRQKLSDSRLLVIIDDADRISDVEKLIPINSRSGIILISQLSPVGVQPGLVIELAGLAAIDARQFADRLARDQAISIPPAVLDEIVKVANGNPYILTLLTKRLFYESPESMLRMLREELQSDRVVSRLGATINIAYESLDDESRHSLRLLSVFGGLVFTVSLASKVLNITGPTIEAQLSHLVSASLLIHEGPDGYRLLHAVQNFARERLLVDEKDETVRRASELAISSLSRRSLRSRTSLARDTWTVQDALGYEQYARAIATFIQHPETKAPLSIAVLGPLGNR